MPKPDDHIISADKVAVDCRTCARPISPEVHIDWANGDYYCAEHCPRCREERKA